MEKKLKCCALMGFQHPCAVSLQSPGNTSLYTRRGSAVVHTPTRWLRSNTVVFGTDERI